MDGPSVRAGDPFFYAASRRQKGKQRDPEHEERTNCFYCLEGWVFLGSLDHDGEEVYEPMRCRRYPHPDRIGGDPHIPRRFLRRPWIGENQGR